MKKLLAYLIVVVTILAGIADLLLTMHGYKIAGDVCAGIYFLGMGAIFWSDSRKCAIFMFVMAGLNFLSMILWVLCPAW